MADKIKIDTAQLERWADQLGQVSSALSRAEDALNRVDTSDDWWRKINMSRSIQLRDAGRTVNISGGRDAVNELKNAIDLYQSRTKNLQRMIDKNAQVFEDAENAAINMAGGLSKGTDSNVYNAAVSLFSAFADILKYNGDYESWTDAMRKEFDKLVKRFDNYGVTADGDFLFAGEGINVLIGPGGRLKLVNEYGFKDLKAFNKLRHYFENGEYAEEDAQIGFNLFKGKDKIKDFKYNRWKDTEDKEGNIPKRVLDIFTVNMSAAEKAAIGHKEGAGKNAYGEGSYSMDFGYAEANAGITAGFYVTKVGEDGKEYMVFEPGVHAEIGASFGLWQGEAEGRLGNDYVAVIGETSASVLEAEAKAEANFGYVNGDLSANVNAELEATLVEAEGKIGLDIMGVEGSVGASVSVGVGAHAEMGYSEGKISYDIGASLGFGFSLSGELDFSGVVDAASNLVDAAQEKCESLVDFLTFWS
ncbi:MAG: hypothetical protein IJC56_12470 [Clostridia bacterium]|nr:hypothetical protein [Clostridia bacterium]